MNTTPALDPTIIQLQEQLLDARADHRQVCIDGNHSKAFYGFPLEGEVLSTRKYTGILHYDPTELVISARAGTALSELETALAANNQMLACEPPDYGSASVGGMLAAGLSGPRRPFAGSVSDQVLGCTIMNGRGEVLRFGGRVMKNVAGYDLSRLMAGSMGGLGIILDTTFKVVPKSSLNATYCFAVETGKMPQFINQLRQHSLPVSASSHDGEWLRVRFSAGTQEISDIERRLNSIANFVTYEAEDNNDYWQQLKNHTLPFFTANRNLWRLSVPATTPALPIPGKTLLEWNGALRWCHSEAAAADIFEAVAKHGGSATLFKADTYQSAEITQRFQPLSAPLLAWHQSIKNALDPDHLLNVGRMYKEL